jgi:hypothetical protein
MRAGGNKDFMHPNLSFNLVQTLWIVTFAAHLVLLVVLLGREHIRRFPWFSASIAFAAMRLLCSRLLYGRLPQITLGTIFVTLADISAILGFIVLIEMGRRSFRGLSVARWSIGAAVIATISAATVWFWGPWPQWKALSFDTLLAQLNLMQLVAQKMTVLTDFGFILLGLLVVTLGRRFGSGWRTHTQRIMIGLFTASISQIAVQLILFYIGRSVVPHSQQEYEHLLAIRDNLLNANNAVYIAVLIWWILCLWREDPESAKAAPEPQAAQPAEQV